MRSDDKVKVRLKQTVRYMNLQSKKSNFKITSEFQFDAEAWAILRAYYSPARQR